MIMTASILYGVTVCCLAEAYVFLHTDIRELSFSQAVSLAAGCSHPALIARLLT